MIDKSFQIIRTNPLLTTNYKVVIDSSHSLYLESFDSNKELSTIKYKHFGINKNSYLEDMVPKFYDGLPKENAFYVKYDNDNDLVYSDYKQQFDDIYYAGCDYISDTWYQEEFQYLAPLYIRKNYLPNGFIVLRVDDPCVYNETNSGYEIGNLNRTNFRTEVIDKWKCVSYFDLSETSDIGNWLRKNFTENERFPLTPFELDTRRVNFSRWFGMDYETGVYTEKPMYLDKNLSIDNPHFRFEKIITEGYKNNSLIFPNILNLQFLFDDTPATPNELKKYSINRYYGFYVENLEFVTNLTSYVTPDLISGTTLINNIIVTGMTGLTWDVCDKEYDPYIPSVNPFVETWNTNKRYFIYIKDDLQEVKRVKNEDNNEWMYKVISEETLDSYWNTVTTYQYTTNIEYDEQSYSYLNPKIGTSFSIDPYTDCSGNDNVMYADLYLIKINDRLHVLKYLSGSTIRLVDTDDKNYVMNKYFIQSDYAITSDTSKLKYWIGGDNSEYYKEVTIENINRKPLVYSVYKVKFSDIKDFDFDRVHTDYSDFDYEKTKYNETVEEKLYTDEFRDESFPRDKKVEPSGSEAQYKIMNISSEYSAGNELFEINKSGDLTDIWRKNQSVCKWGFMGSISHSDYQYKLNNNLELGSLLNRSVDTFSTRPTPLGKNLDYFYRVGNLYDSNGDLYYLNQSTNIQTEFISKIDSNGLSQNGGDSFNMGIYFEINAPSNFDFDYFNFFFNNNMYIQDNNLLFNKTFVKYAVLNNGTLHRPPSTVFKGIKFSVSELVDIIRDDDGFITRVITKTSEKYNGYKLSIILNDVYYNQQSGIPYVVNGINNYNGIININDNGIHIIMNEKYKNILIIINVGIIISSGSNTFNNVELYHEKIGLYKNIDVNGNIISTNYNPNMLVASNFINALNDMNNKYSFDNYIRYHYIKEENGITITGSTSINGSDNIIPPSFIIEASKPDEINIKTNSYVVSPIYGPSPLSLYSKQNILANSQRINEPLARSIIVNPNIDNTIGVYTDYSNKVLSTTSTNKIYRHRGQYEPIFKNIDVFRPQIFCYDGFYTGLTAGTTTYESEFTLSTSVDQSLGDTFATPAPSWRSWRNTSSDSIHVSTYGAYVNVPIPTSPEETTYYVLFSDFDFPIPTLSTINGITVDIERKTHESNGTDIYVRDYVVGITSNGINFQSDSPLSDNKADTGPYWPSTFTTKTYGSSSDKWGLTWNSTKINSTNFGVYIAVSVRYQSAKEGGSKVMPDIRNVSVTVNYDYSGTTINYTSFNNFDRNLKFDETLYNFGVVDEQIYSKVNISNRKILRFKDNKYPMVDQYGYSYDERFIFKSNWDNDFYWNTLETFEDDDTTFTKPVLKTGIRTYSDPSGQMGTA